MKNPFAAAAAFAALSGTAQPSNIRAIAQNVRRQTLLDHYDGMRALKPGKRTLKPEVLYRDLIRAGILKVVRQKGKAPKIVWIT